MSKENYVEIERMTHGPVIAKITKRESSANGWGAPLYSFCLYREIRNADGAMVLTTWLHRRLAPFICEILPRIDKRINELELADRHEILNGRAANT